ncbi:MAG: 2-C-methyl-D-erythritol 4-phosphate cytidylyltransferase [Deltaproteobacteria bacterium]|nr:2-C-methyl-D-erythritol 4-phosphate cytidylyltransferase [Deltaproteobacteria bacterium]
MAEVVAIIVAGGAGKRMGGDAPKQFLRIGGRPILDLAISAIAASPLIDGIVLALPHSQSEEVKESYRARPKVLQVIDGGEERQDSVENALAAVPPETEIILVHDAVRPFASRELLELCVTRAREHGAVVPVVPLRDTVKMWDLGGKTLATVDRSLLFRAQTPQAFRADILRNAFEKAKACGRKATDDASIVEAAGYQVTPIPGEEGNIKITVPEDLRMARGLLGESPDFRIGLGGDAHRLVEGRELWLGGIRVEYPRGLLGHSDGDVLLHAIADAIYGALGDRDIGHHFPPGRDETKGISSRTILEHARGRMDELGFSLVGLDAVVVCEEPKIAPIASALRESIAGMLSVSGERISLKGKTTEGMGFEGRKEGISAWAVALLQGTAPQQTSEGTIG